MCLRTWFCVNHMHLRPTPGCTTGQSGVSEFDSVFWSDVLCSIRCPPNSRRKRLDCLPNYHHKILLTEMPNTVGYFVKGGHFQGSTNSVETAFWGGILARIWGGNRHLLIKVTTTWNRGTPQNQKGSQLRRREQAGHSPAKRPYRFPLTRLPS